MKKIVSVLAMAFVAVSLFAAPKIKVGIVNNPPSESGYRAANVKDFEAVFTKKNGYSVKTYYSLKNDEQLNAASQFIVGCIVGLARAAFCRCYGLNKGRSVGF